jgi:hypothetical protein
VNDRPEAVVGEALLDALRPFVDQMVKVELDRRLGDLGRRDEVEYLTTGEYAERFKTTADAVGARIRRGTLDAIRPPGSREWLIPVDRGYHEP